MIRLRKQAHDTLNRAFTVKNGERVSPKEMGGAQNAPLTRVRHSSPSLRNGTPKGYFTQRVSFSQCHGASTDPASGHRPNYGMVQDSVPGLVQRPLMSLLGLLGFVG